MSPPVAVPPAPVISAERAVQLANEEVFRSPPHGLAGQIYCVSVQLNEPAMSPDPIEKQRHWKLLYRIAGETLTKRVGGYSFGDFNVWVTMEGTVKIGPCIFLHAGKQ